MAWSHRHWVMVMAVSILYVFIYHHRVYLGRRSTARINTLKRPCCACYAPKPAGHGHDHYYIINITIIITTTAVAVAAAAAISNSSSVGAALVSATETLEERLNVVVVVVVVVASLFCYLAVVPPSLPTGRCQRKRDAQKMPEKERCQRKRDAQLHLPIGCSCRIFAHVSSARHSYISFRVLLTICGL